ncbi:uncharacterized protein LOC123300751 [Chrysoperla carnea]|uniref:uncharacterized protein LOC123300751 n=1 Tax=Chrysoperla carnea TaxID=189513 RepID=UPI001D06684E|nr:uncharacterized protein LOC123300751 [Chrysoperla carnea]
MCIVLGQLKNLNIITMKILVILSLCLCLFLNIASTRFVNEYSALDDKIIRILDKYRNELADGKWIFPPLDPFVVPAFNVSYENKIAKVDGISKALNASGIIGYEDHVVETTLDGDFSVYVNEPLVKVIGEYKSEGKLASAIPVNGEGSYTCDVKNLQITVYGKLSENKDETLYLERLNVTLHVEEIKFKIDGLQGGKLYNDMVSAIVSDGAPAFINANVPLFDEFVGTALKHYLNPIFNDYTAAELIDFINSIDA